MTELEYLTKRVEKLEKTLTALILSLSNSLSSKDKEELLKMLDMSQEDI